MIISVVIRAFNEDHHIGRLLVGIARQAFSKETEVEVVLVDSGSTDSTVAIASSMGAKVVHIKKEEFSFGRALNVGCKQAKGDILVFASAHVYPVYTDWLESMIRPFTDEKIALVYGKQEGNDKTRFSEHQVFAQWFTTTSNLDQNSPFCNNANCAIRRDLWLNQPYDETLTGLEDLDWAEKIMKRGYKISYCAEAPIVHVHEETAKKIKHRYQREALALKNIMPHVHFNLWDFITHLIQSVIKDSAVALKKGILLKELRGILIFRLMQYQGTYKGHNLKGNITKELKSKFYYPASGINKLIKEEERHQKKINYIN